MAGKKSKAPRQHPGRFDSGVRKFIEIPAPKDPSKNPFRRKTQDAAPAEKPRQESAPKADSPRSDPPKHED